MSKTIIKLLIDRCSEKPKSNEIHGTWKKTGSILQTWDITDTTQRSFKYIPLETNIIIKQDIDKDNFCMVYNKPYKSQDISLRNESGFQPGILSTSSGDKLELTLADYDDNGVFKLIETKRDLLGRVVEFEGVYSESGYGASLLQVPTVGKITLVKVNDDDTIVEPIINNNLVKHTPINPSDGNELYWNIDDLYAEYLTPLGLNYTIKFTGPVYNKDDKKFGMISSVNEYSIDKGVELCKSTSTYSMFDKIDPVQSYKNPKEPYIVPKNIKIIGTFITESSYEGNMRNKNWASGISHNRLISMSGFGDLIKVNDSEKNIKSRGFFGDLYEAIASPVNDAGVLIVSLLVTDGGATTSPSQLLKTLLIEQLERHGYIEGEDYHFPPNWPYDDL
jgi:hypothetical protein